VLLLLALFVLAQLAVGFWAARQIGSEDDFLVAGRRLGPVLAASSIFATWFGAESCVGAAGSAYDHGLHADTTEPFAYGLCLVLMGLFFATRLHAARVTTLADYFAQRFGHGPERLVAVLLLPSSLLWAAAQVRAFGHVVASNADGAVTETTATWIAAAVAILYTVSGGLLADVYTDVVQGALLLLGLGVLGIAVWQHLPAAETAAAATPAAAAAATTLSGLDVAEAWAVPICGSIVAQEALSRCLAARSPGVARNAALWGGGVYLLVGLVPLSIGLVGPRLAPGLADPETLLPHLSSTLLPAVLNLVFAGALISAILSTVDSCLLVASSIVVRNLLPRRGAGPDKGRLALARLAAAVAGGIALALALSRWNVKELVEQASGFGSAGVFVLAVFGVYTRIGRAAAAVGALLAGLSAWILGGYVFVDHIHHPYLTSLAAALAGFTVGAAIDRRRSHQPSHPVAA
jgi:Na+/proline symporter